MTTEMGPRDVDLGVTERVAGHCVRFWAWAASLDDDDPNVRFDPTTATTRVTGESEYSGDAFVRGRAVTILALLNVIVGFGLIGMLAAVPVPNTAVGWAFAAVATALMIATGVVVHGSMKLVGKINVVDHTTEPTPDALDELQQQYVDGEIDESELGDRAAEVWER